MARKKKLNDVNPLIAADPFERPTRRRIVFDGADSEGVLSREVRNVELTGTLRGDRTAPTCNIVEAVLQGLTAEYVNFYRCDFKDNAIRVCRFVECNFGSSSFAYNAVVGSRFENCSFPDTDIHNCDFYDTIFIECDLRSVLVKTCSFTHCEFQNCRTNNKVFETSRFGDCRFDATELQIQTIEDNFGIMADHYDGTLRDGRGDGPHGQISISKLPSLLSDSSRHPLKKLSIDYFVRGSPLEQSAFLDAALSLDAWQSMSKNPGSFAVVLGQWVEFILWLYERDQLTAYTVIRSHDLTSRLSTELYAQAAHHQALTMFSGTLTVIDGARSSLARSVERYLGSVEVLARTAKKEITLLVEGGHAESYYYQELAPVFTRADGRINKLEPYNSPWQLQIVLGQHADPFHLAALFLATRLRLEIYRIPESIDQSSRPALPAKKGDASLKKGRNLPAVRESSGYENLFALDMPNLRMMAYFPGSRLSVTLKLDLGSQQIVALRRIIIDWLTGFDDPHDIDDAP